MKRFVITAALVLAAGRGWAADLPQPAPPPPQAPAAYVPAPAPVYNWGGLYFGINGGYGFGSSSWGLPFSTGDFNVSGYAAGVTIGANMQFDAFVIGVDGDFDAMGTDGSTSTNCAAANCETKNTWLATLRGRIGFAVDRVLFYGTAGGAYGNIRGNTSTTFQSASEPGWTAGAGIEVAIGDNWTARAEYLFVDLENASLPTPAAATNTTVKLDENVVRLGIDYKFH